MAERPQLLCHPPVYYTWQPCLLTDDLDAVAPNSYLISQQIPMSSALSIVIVIVKVIVIVVVIVIAIVLVVAVVAVVVVVVVVLRCCCGCGCGCCCCCCCCCVVVVFCFVLFCFVLFCFVLFCLFFCLFVCLFVCFGWLVGWLFGWLVWFCFVLVLFCFVCLVLFGFVWFCLVLFGCWLVGWLVVIALFLKEEAGEQPKTRIVDNARPHGQHISHHVPLKMSMLMAWGCPVFVLIHQNTHPTLLFLTLSSVACEVHAKGHH